MGENKAREFDRRRFLKTTAAASLGTGSAPLRWDRQHRAGAGQPAAAARAGPDPAPRRRAARAWTWSPRAPPPRVASGSCSRTSRRTRPRMTLLDRLGADHGGAADRRLQAPARLARHVPTRTTTTRFNENPNPALTSGFTFVGQFVDHDITFDTTPLSEQQSDPDATTNFRTPRYDLDAIYGRGPSHEPAVLRPQRPGQVPDRRDVPTTRSTASAHDPDERRRDMSTTCKPDVVWDVPRATPRRQGHHRRPPQRPDADHPPASRGHAEVPQQAGGLHAQRPECPGRRCSSRPGAWPGGTTSGW